MSVHQLKDGRWFVKFSQAGKPRREYFGRGQEAERQAHRRNLELGLGLQRRASAGPTFRELAAQYGASRSPSMARETVANISAKLAGIILPAIGDRPAAKITPEVLDGFVTDRRKAGRKLATIHYDLTIIRAILRWSVKRRLLAHNPMEGFEFPTRDDAVIAPPTRAELAAIYAASPPHLQRVIMLGAYTGMRVGASELLALRWDQVDLINGTIFVESARKGGMVSRMVPIAEQLGAMLREWMEQDARAGPLQWVVQFNGRRIYHINRGWWAALKRAGITRRLRPYDLRHMAASSMLDGGADLKSVSEILGHSSPDLTLRTYQHTNTALRRDAIRRIGNQLPAGAENAQGKSDV